MTDPSTVVVEEIWTDAIRDPDFKPTSVVGMWKWNAEFWVTLYKELRLAKRRGIVRIVMSQTPYDAISRIENVSDEERAAMRVVLDAQFREIKGWSVSWADTKMIFTQIT